MDKSDWIRENRQATMYKKNIRVELLKHTPKGNPYRTAYHWHAESKFTQFGYEYQAYLATRFIRSYDHILDLGCGDGRLTWLLAKLCSIKNVQVHGVDYQYDAINLANEKCRLHCLPNLTYSIVDYKKPLPNNLYDVITLFDVIEHVHPNDVKNLLALINEHLNPRGRIIITTPNRDSLKNRIFGHVINNKHYKEYNMCDLRQTCAIEQAFFVEWYKGIYFPLPILKFIKNEFLWIYYFRMCEAFPSLCNKIAICLYKY